jgi:antirestriction protein ArdC
MLLDPGEYLTWNQITQAKGSLIKGSKAHLVVFWKQSSYTKLKDDGEKEEKTIPCLRYFNVYNIKDCKGIESKLQDQIIIHNNPIDEAENTVKDYLKRSNCKLEFIEGSDRAFYSPSEDKIVMPIIHQFNSSEEYYSTLFHENVHSTGHTSRLKRLTKNASFGSQVYSKEELVAEIGSTILCNEVGFDTSKTFQNNVAYIQSWLKALRNDKTLIMSASSLAEKAVNLILNRKGGE